MDIGSTWGYRVKIYGPLTPVTVIRTGVQKPAKVYVRFEDFKYEGKHKWVLRSQLRVPWTDATRFLALEAKWDEVLRLSPGQETAEFDAVHAIYDNFMLDVDVSVIFLHWRDAHATTRDPAALATYLRWSTVDLLAHPATFETSDSSGVVHVLPWPTVQQIVQTVMRHKREATWEWVAAHGQSGSEPSARGRFIPGEGNPPVTNPDEARARHDQDDLPLLEVLRQWLTAPYASAHPRRQRLSNPVTRSG